MGSSRLTTNAIIFLLCLSIWSCRTTRSDVAPAAVVSPIKADTAEVSKPSESNLRSIRALENQLEQYRATRSREFDLLHTALDLRFDFDAETVAGEAILTLKPYFYPQKTLVLDAKDFDIFAFGLLENGQTNEMNFHYDGRRVTAFLPKVFTRKDTLTVRIRYTANPNRNSGIAGNAITDTKGLYFVNPKSTSDRPTQIWTQGETEYNSKWFPTIDSPNERATQEIKLTVPSKYRTLSNGILTASQDNGDGSRTDRWKLDLPHAPYLAAIAVGDFVEIEDNWNGMPVQYYVEREYEKGGKIVFQHTPEMIGFFSDLLGVKYPWPHYHQVVVRDFVTGAMENTTLSIFMEALNLNEREAIDSEWDGIIAHELFHQWFGNYVTTESWSNLTLNEAFATYSEYLWYAHKNGQDEADLHHVSEIETYLEEAETKQEDLIRFFYDKPDDMFDSHSYAKGGAILHMLRRVIGDEAFFLALKHYLEKHAFQAVEVHELRIAFEEVSGMDLNWFFNQWFLASGHPVLSYEVDYSQPNEPLLTVSQNQDFASTPLYRIPFRVSWYEGELRKEKDLILDKAWQQFAIETGSPVQLLFVDEGFDLLAVRHTNRGKDHFVQQFHTSQLGISRYEALDSLKSNYAGENGMVEVVKAALADDFWAIREMALMAIAENQALIKAIPALEETIYKMADSDQKNTVRLGAIELLATIDPDKYSSDFLRWMNQPSYYVAGAALSAYLENENNLQREEIAERFRDEKNIRVLVALAGYALSERKGGEVSWFNEKLDELNGESKYYFIGYYSEYFAAVATEESESAINKLGDIAKHDKENYVRIAAFMGLFGFIDQPGVLAMAREISQQESDPLAKGYQEMFLSQYEEGNK